MSPSPLSATHEDAITVRGHDLAGELIGHLTFTEMLLLDLHGERPAPEHVRVVDAVLVAVMEHGITPSTLAARLVLDGAPESMQGAVAAGLLATGSRFLGVIEEAARLLRAIVEDEGEPHEAAARAVRAVVATGEHVPGLGHNLHRREDPRVQALLAVAEREGTAGPHARALAELPRAAEEAVGRPLIVNAAGAVAAVLSDLGYAPHEVRGFALVARCGGLFAHVVDEQRHPIARAVWQGAHEAGGGA